MRKLLPPLPGNLVTLLGHVYLIWYRPGVGHNLLVYSGSLDHKCAGIVQERFEKPDGLQASSTTFPHS